MNAPITALATTRLMDSDNLPIPRPTPDGGSWDWLNKPATWPVGARPVPNDWKLTWATRHGRTGWWLFA